MVGKSTLVDRLLSSNAVLRDSSTSGELEEGTIPDASCHRLATPRRNFLIEDPAGGASQTRELANAAAGCDLAVLLVDVVDGITQQTTKDASIVQAAGIRNAVLAVNKMDLVGFEQRAFADIVAKSEDIARKLGFAAITAVPVSALTNENITEPSRALPWYDGPTLLQHLETIDLGTHSSAQAFRMAVQSINRAKEAPPTLAGTILSGGVVSGDDVVALPSARTSRVMAVRSETDSSEPARPGDAVMLRLADDIQVAPGDVICAAKDRPMVGDQFAVNLVWLHAEPLLAGRSYNIELAGQTAVANVSRIKHKIDPETLDAWPARELNGDDVAHCNISLSQRLVVEPCDANRALGSFILTDRTTNETVGAGTVEHVLYRSQNIHLQSIDVSKRDRLRIKGHDACCIWFTGLSGSGKSSIANALERQLHARRCPHLHPGWGQRAPRSQ